MGTLWELCRNILGTMWEHFGNQGLCIPYYTLYKCNILYYVVHTLYCIVPTYCKLQWEVNYKGQYSTSIFSTSPLTMIMGQSFPRWEQCWEH
jgi:hypothetical protein